MRKNANLCSPYSYTEWVNHSSSALWILMHYLMKLYTNEPRMMARMIQQHKIIICFWKTGGKRKQRQIRWWRKTSLYFLLKQSEINPDVQCQEVVDQEKTAYRSDFKKRFPMNDQTVVNTDPTKHCLCLSIHNPMIVDFDTSISSSLAPYGEGVAQLLVHNLPFEPPAGI